ncbi:MAG: LysM peptidoglycan-binding domain-containing protein, partial [Cyanobacteria bacterium SZAS-4]|nr:LysM peptidoglycan-binding domain-containing protein [Cyanobacteria bacterium SZAS-4]
MVANRAEQVEAAQVVKPEAATLSNQQISQQDNVKLQEMRASNAQNLKDAGILPDIELVQKNFDKIDASHDGYVTKKEIDEYVKNHKELTKEEAAALTRVGEQVDKLQKLNNDEWGRENSGVSQKDLQVANENSKAMEYAQKHFDRLDGDGNGHITKDEIDAYVKANGDKLSPEDRAALETLKKNYSKIEDYSNDEWGFENDGITRHDLIEGRKKEGTENLNTGAKDNSPVSAYGDLRPALDYAQKNFDKLDADKNGYISEKDIDKYIEDNKGKLSIEELQNLRALKQSISKIEDVNNDEWGPETKGMSKKDIAGAKEEIDTLVYAQKNFDKLDGDGDGHVTAKEIEGYIRARGNDLTPDELQKLEALKKQVSDLESKHNDEWGIENDGFTRHDLVDALKDLGSADARDRSGDTKPADQNPGDQKPGDQKPGDQKPGDQKPGDQKPGDEKPGAEKPEAEKPKDHEYTVKPGDSFWKIAKENLKAQTGHEPTNAEVVKAMNDLAKANHKKLTDVIHPGDKLTVPGPDMSGVQNGAEQGESEQRGGEQRRPEQRGREQRPEKNTDPQEENENEPEEEQGPEQSSPAHQSAAQVLRERFSQIDKDGNNHISKKEIETYVAQHQDELSADETRALDMLAHNVDKVEKLVNDQKGFERGISRQDLDKLDELSATSTDFLAQGR